MAGILKNLLLNSPLPQLLRVPNICTCRVASFHVSKSRNDLMEFFDEKQNWTSDEVKSGRSWRISELRIKSNSDLHKLWYVLLKELNMLLTMQHECKRLSALFPNPERIDRVKESMKNLEDTVRERNKAYYQLETGHEGERPTQVIEDVLGRKMFYKMKEYPIPHHMNTNWLNEPLFNHWDPPHVIEFKKLWREKIDKEKDYKHIMRGQQCLALMKKFPHLTDEVLQQHYPDIDIGRVRKKWSRRHW